MREIKTTELERRIDMRPVRETIKKIIMVPKKIAKEVTKMHNEVRTRMVAREQSKIVLKKETYCTKEWKEVPVKGADCTIPSCDCLAGAKASDGKPCNCPPKACKRNMFTLKAVDKCTQKEVPKHVHYTVMEPEEYTV